jgi:hypothetical protein
MAWFSEKTVSDGWSQKMKDSFPAFVRTVRERLGMELIIYSGCANMPNVGTTLRPQLKDGSVDLIPEYLAAARYIAGLGCTGIGMDGYTLLQEKDPAAAVQIIAALRADPATRDLIYVIEGWPAPNASQPYIQQQMVSLDLFRGGHMTEPDNFTKFASRVDRERELRAVPGRVGVWLIHSNPWSDAQLRKGYDLIREWGMVPMDWRTDAPGRFWRR